MVTRMRKFLIALFAGAILSSPALADWTGKNAATTTITFKNPNDCTSVVCTPIAAIADSTGANLAAVPTAGADAQSNTLTGLLTYSRMVLFNGATWDRWTGAVTNAGTFAVQLTGATNNINNISGTVSLPTGAATSALQTTGNTSLSSIDTKTPALASNAGSGVATTSTNVPAIAYLYGFNGTTYDQLQVDGSKNLKVNVITATGLAAGSTTSGQTGSMTMAAVNAADPTYTDAQTNYTSQDIKGHTRVVLGGGVPETASATGTTAATTATLATAVGKTTYICGFSIRANATAAATGNATVTGTITGTLNFTQWTAPNASGVGVTEEIFTPCIPASTTNTSIAVVSAAPGTGGVVSVSAWGYQQ